MSAAFARRAIEAAGKTVAPGVGEAELAAHGRDLIAGRAKEAAPAHLVAGGGRQEPAAAPARSTPSTRPSSTRTARPGPSLGGVGRAASSVASGAAGPASGGLVSGDSAIGRLFGGLVVGLGALVIGSMVLKRDFAINVGGATASPAIPSQPHGYQPIYNSAGVVVGAPRPGAGPNTPPHGPGTGPLA